MSTYKDFYDYETVDFIAACPVEDCKNNNESYKWVHTKCGNFEKLNSKGILKCNNNDAIGPLVNWRFNCGNHDYKPASLQGLLHCCSLMGSLDGVNMTFLLDLMESVKQQFN